jgi:crotonobetainyl-CoA:carnitine CoA-transferase CaiB-like acyl-CoA transferase
LSEAKNGAETPLEGLWVVEMGSLLAGTFCGQLLTDFGAEVIKVEPSASSAGPDRSSANTTPRSTRKYLASAKKSKIVYGNEGSSDARRDR